MSPRTFSPRRWRSGGLIAGVAFCSSVLSFAATSAGTEVTAVFSRTFNGYERIAGASTKPETYAFAPGLCFNDALTDPSLDPRAFQKIARVLLDPLRSQSYVCAVDPNQTDLLLVLSWGCTTGSGSADTTNGRRLMTDAMQRAGRSGGDDVPFVQPGLHGPSRVNRGAQAVERLMAASELGSAMAMNDLENQQRDALVRRNAGILGYQTLLARASDRPEIGNSREVIGELEANRYFVVLKAYDFQLLWKQRMPKLLWETRYSVAEQGTRFADHLAAMTQAAAPFFGRNVGELVHKPIRRGSVEVGTPSVIESDLAR